MVEHGAVVLNLIINGIPSILKIKIDNYIISFEVLNLIINGIPSILKKMLVLINHQLDEF